LKVGIGSPGVLRRARNWLRDDGRLFMHVFNHRAHSYRFDHETPEDWIAQHFFNGGIMPGADLPRRFAEMFEVEAQWRWSGEHYRRTSMDWLANFDARRARIDPLFNGFTGIVRTYGRSDGGCSFWRRRVFSAMRAVKSGALAIIGCSRRPQRMRESIVTSIAWIIFANKPVYPLYLWFYVGSGAPESVWTMLAAPLYAAIALVARRASLPTRVALPLAGAADTIFATKLFGVGAGTELFFAPCAMIAALSFDVPERKIARGLIAGILIAFAALHRRYGHPGMHGVRKSFPVF
jgi:hypothetical protein